MPVVPLGVQSICVHKCVGLTLHPLSQSSNLAFGESKVGKIIAITRVSIPSELIHLLKCKHRDTQFIFVFTEWGVVQVTVKQRIVSL